LNGSSFGREFRIRTYGSSHGGAVGVIIEGCPAGIRLSTRAIQRELDRRRPGKGPTVSGREEPDRLDVVSGISGRRTTGGPIRLQVRNIDARPSEYDDIVFKPRPGHADLSYFLKYGRIPVGGGRSSGRETVGRVLAGAVAKQLLSREGVQINGKILEIGGRRAGHRRTILRARARKDSVGGIVEVIAEGVPPGLGEPVFHGLDAELARALMGIGSVKGVEVGSGFAAARSSGSRNNDAIIVMNGRLATRTNNAGGILGGISNGMPVVCKIAVKPTSSIGIEQDTVDLRTMRPAKLTVEGRHDPCICQRIVPVAEAMVAIVLLDHLWRARKESGERRAEARGDEMTSLARLRREVGRGDEQMVRLMGRRMALAERIGKAKMAMGLPIRDAGAERRVLANAKRTAKMAKVAQGIVKRLIEDLMAEARRRQKRIVGPKGRKH